MTNQFIIVFSLFLVYYHISGLATTNILRLTANNTLPILSSKCYCDNCGATIPPLLQLPIISYLICRGKCKNCGTKIPLFPLLLEIIIFLGMSIISSLMKYSYISISISFLYYEVVRIVTILVIGKRTSQFGKQYFIAVLSMIPFYLSSLFIVLLYKIV